MSTPSKNKKSTANTKVIKAEPTPEQEAEFAKASESNRVTPVIVQKTLADRAKEETVRVYGELAMNQTLILKAILNELVMARLSREA